MKVFDLQCALGHKFEGWFASENEYQKQIDEGMLECPLCGNKHVNKIPTSARLTRKSNQVAEQRNSKSPALGASSRLTPEDMQRLEAKVLNHIVENTEDVGTAFAEEARRIHYGESPERGIRGQATLDEAKDLKEEGVTVVTLPYAPIPKKDLQ